MQEYYEYRIGGYQHRQRVFAWQLVSSKIIFIVVTVLVLVGIYFSWVQFRGSIKRQTKANARRKDEEMAEEMHTEVEASLSGVRVSSPVLGVIILMISFLFFYLYLVYVYPISELF